MKFAQPLFIIVGRGFTPAALLYHCKGFVRICALEWILFGGTKAPPYGFGVFLRTVRSNGEQKAFPSGEGGSHRLTDEERERELCLNCFKSRY